jgi:TrpR-related protein YerC/YecD
MMTDEAPSGPNHETRVDDLVDTIASLGDRDLTARFLKDLCTRNELDAMAQRWEVAQLVDQGVPYLQIAKRTGASTATITRVASWLRHGEGGYATVIKERRS